MIKEGNEYFEIVKVGGKKYRVQITEKEYYDRGLAKVLALMPLAVFCMGFLFAWAGGLIR